MTAHLSAARTAALVAGFDRSPAYAGVARKLAVAIGDGRIPLGTRLPSERDLAEALGLSRTTATRAYDELGELGYAQRRRGSGTFAQVAGGRARTLDRSLTPQARDDAIDLNCAASSAPAGIAEACAAALSALPAYLSGHGYYPAGLPVLQAQVARWYTERALPTRPEQILVTAGALAATALAARALVRAGDRVVVESPGYPNAMQSWRASGARPMPVPVDEQGWDLGLLDGVLRHRPRAALLVPDFHNPTGHLMSDETRAAVAGRLAAAGTVAVVDETLQPLGFAGAAMPVPLARHVERAGGEAITVGGAGKMFWGGLRIGWLRAPAAWMEQLTEARLTMDLGAPVLEQLATAELLSDPEPILHVHRERLRRQRDALVGAMAARLPHWRFQVPEGGLALWCALPGPMAVDVAQEAERRGVVVTPGAVFGPQGGYPSRLRVPFTRPVADLEQAAEVLAEACGAAVRQAPARRVTRRPVVA